MNKLLVAVDGGGSSTRLWVLDANGGKLAEGRGGPSSVMAVGAERAIQAVADAAEEAGLTGTDERIAVVAITMAGVDREPENSQIRTGVQRLFPGARVIIEHDAVGALLAGSFGEPGVLLLAGTGSISLSRGPGGELVRVGGWGYLVDDVGSGYWLGMQGVRRSLRAEDGRGAPTVLTQVLQDETGVETILDLVGPIHYGTYDRPAVARWASLVVQAADAGDEVAATIVEEGAAELALLVKTVIRRAPWLTDDTVPVVAAGGLFAMGPTWRERVQRALARVAPHARLTVWVKAPIVGAAWIALQRYYDSEAGASTGRPIPDEVMERLKLLQQQSVEPF